MYDIKIIKRALKLLKQYDYSFIKVSRKLGIKVPTLRKWRNKEINNEPLLLHTRNKSSKWSESFKSEILDYYFQHGENMMKTQRKFGEPSYSMLKRWVKEDKRYIQKHFVKKTPIKYNIDKKKKIVIEAASRTSSMNEIAAKYDVTRETIYLWEKELAGGPIMKEKEKTKDELKDEIKKLKQEHQKLEMENKILKKANELIKKEMGANFNNLTNKEKTIIVSALKSEYKITELIKVLNIKKSTYFYELKHLSDDKYKDIRY